MKSLENRLDKIRNDITVSLENLTNAEQIALLVQRLVTAEMENCRYGKDVDKLRKENAKLTAINASLTTRLANVKLLADKLNIPSDHELLLELKRENKDENREPRFQLKSSKRAQTQLQQVQQQPHEHQPVFTQHDQNLPTANDTTPTTPLKKPFSEIQQQAQALKLEQLSAKKEIEEEKRRRAEREAERFKNFFVKIETSRASPTRKPSTAANQRFMPFHVKEGMRLAPIHVRPPLNQHEYNAFLHGDTFQNCEYNYLSDLKLKKQSGSLKVKIKPEIVAVDENGVGLKVKLLQFLENVRPPYYGTFRKRSATVSARRPFATDSTLNYEYDSDQDWEEEPSDAEECKSDDDDDLEKDDEDDEENDGFFVEHGYLSSDEGSDVDATNSDNDAAADLQANSNAQKRCVKPTIGTPSDATKRVAHPHRRSGETDEQRRHRLAQRAEEWKESQKMKMKRYRKSTAVMPTIFGPSWTDDETTADDKNLEPMEVDTQPIAQKRPKSHLPAALMAQRQLRAVVICYNELSGTSSEPPAT